MDEAARALQQRARVGWARPAPWLLALLLVVILSLLRISAVSRVLRVRHGARARPSPIECTPVNAWARP